MKLDIKYFAKLARVKLSPEEEEKFSGDLGKILNHFNELQELDTTEVKPMTGGTELRNVFREDEPREERSGRTGVEQFPKTKDDFLSVPKVFE